MTQEAFERFARGFLAFLMVLVGLVMIVAAWKAIF